MVRVGIGAGVQVGHKRAGALVAALAAAVDNTGGADGAGVLHSLNGLEEILRRPGAVLQINILEGIGLLKYLVVDGHAVGGHAQGVLIVGPVGALAGVDHSFAHSGNVGGGGFVPQVAQIHHLAGGTPVGDQALGALHNDIGSRAAVDGGHDAVVAVGVVQILDIYRNVGIDCVKIGNHIVDSGGLAAPGSDGVGPQRNGNGFPAGLAAGSLRLVLRGLRGGRIAGAGAAFAPVAACGQGKNHTQRQCKGKSSFQVHASTLLVFDEFFGF